MIDRRANGRPLAAVTIGVFDGVHLGHLALIERLRVAAEPRDALRVAFTFGRHPLAVLDPPRCPPRLTTADERRALLEAAGVDRVHVLEFDADLANTSARSFIESVVFSRYDLAALVAGPDFAMGRDRRGDLGVLERLGEECGFELHRVGAVPVDGAPVSSSRIRTLVESGEVAGAARLLGRPYTVAGRVETGDARGRQLGFPTANLASTGDKLLPGSGVYAGWASVEALGTRQPCVVNIGVAPTFGGSRRRVEAHLLDWSGDLVGAMLEVAFDQRLRAERRFESVEALKAQIGSDVGVARRILGLGTETPAADGTE